ncbi:hypothetical protein HMPREF1403_00853 [Helicobacter pylori GAM201Ai]|nr:hypothetical protein HMPREF1403_00853 [Helicobacter pylori GAM201Ai]
MWDCWRVFRVFKITPIKVEKRFKNRFKSFYQKNLAFTLN